MTRKRTSENDLSLSAGASATPSRRKPASRTRAKHVVPNEAPTTSAAEPEIAVLQVVAPVAAPPVEQLADQLEHGEIAKLAFLYWEQRGCQGGSPEEDWLRAENELRTRATVLTA